jgi:hypothetical protein
MEQRMSSLSALVQIPDTKLAKDATQILRQHSTEVLLNHSIRVYLFAAAQGRQAKLQFDPELLYVGAAFHDLGLVRHYSSKTEQFEVDGADAVRHFLIAHRVPEEQIQITWQAVALHATPDVARHLHPEAALLSSGVHIDVLREGFDRFPKTLRKKIFAAYPRMSESEGARGILGWLRTQARCDLGYVQSECLRALYSWEQERRPPRFQSSPHFSCGNKNQGVPISAT